ncbi:hypothetical protein yfred0001_37190 [Yersinia frederiksenii ATCC 33641]|nr:hypothetical protein yfred0001_37190 [Yersinia frederiksenii ATCC 33641]
MQGERGVLVMLFSIPEDNWQTVCHLGYFSIAVILNQPIVI